MDTYTVIVVKGDARDSGPIPGLGRSPGGGQDDPLQYSCLENPVDRAAWQATVHGVAKSQTQLKRLSTHTSTITGEERGRSRQGRENTEAQERQSDGQAGSGRAGSTPSSARWSGREWPCGQHPVVCTALGSLLHMARSSGVLRLCLGRSWHTALFSWAVLVRLFIC